MSVVVSDTSPLHSLSLYLGHHVNIRFGQGQVTAAAESNNLNVLTLFLSEYALALLTLRPRSATRTIYRFTRANQPAR